MMPRKKLRLKKEKKEQPLLVMFLLNPPIKIFTSFSESSERSNIFGLDLLLVIMSLKLHIRVKLLRVNMDSRRIVRMPMSFSRLRNMPRKQLKI